MQKQDFRSSIVAAIQTLPERQRAIVTKRILEQKSFEEIAQSIGAPVDTVKTIYYRSTEAIRKKLPLGGLLD